MAKITHVCVAILLVLITTLPAGARYLEMLRAAAYHEGVPDSLMLAIAWVESQGVLTALNIDGAPVFPTTWDEGRGLILQHARENIDVGVMQVNVPSWGHRFGLITARQRVASSSTCRKFGVPTGASSTRASSVL